MVRISRPALGFLIFTGAIAVKILPAKESDHHQPIAWCYVQEGPLELVRKAAFGLPISRKVYMPVWKAPVEFFAVGQDKPIESVRVTKTCPWTGAQFEPVQ